MTDIASGILSSIHEEPIPEPADDVVVLPGGFRRTDGSVVRTVQIRELNGADEEALARASRSNDLLAYYRTLMERCLIKVGSASVEQNDPVFDQLLIGDRDAILLQTRIATYGPEYETRISCPKCSQDSDVAFDLSEAVPVRTLADPEIGFRHVDLRKPGTSADIRLVTVLDQEDAASDMGRTPAEMNSILLGRVVSKLNGVETLGRQSMLTLSGGDRRILVKHLLDTAPGPRLGEVMALCMHCGIESTIPLSLAALFL